jgi:hypothetical protein
MQLDCYAIGPTAARLKAARPDRRWMDEFPSRHAYRCLPLSIANCHGWELLCPTAFSIRWNGAAEADAIQFDGDDTAFPLEHFVLSNFTHGIVTFHTGYIFRTEPGWNLLATGPFNQPKDGISPLTGVVETSWLPYPFTMNWQLTRPGVVRFEKDEPFCLVMPLPARALEEVEPRINDLASNGSLAGQYLAWRDKRTEFMTAYRAGDAATLREAWQKFYFKGQLASGAPPDCALPEVDHVQKLRLAEPVDLRKPVQASALGEGHQQSPALQGWHVHTATASRVFSTVIRVDASGQQSLPDVE